MSEGVEWAIHCCTVLAFLDDQQALPAAKLAEFHGVPPAYLAKHLQALVRAGVCESVSGPRGGFRLARGRRRHHAPRHHAGRRRRRDGVPLQRDPPARARRSARRLLPRACGIAAAMWRAEEAWRARAAGR